MHAEEFVTTTGHSFKNYHVHVEKKTLGEIGHGIVKFARGGTGKTKKFLGRNGPQCTSHTTWKNGKTERIDVENPNPGERDGQIHYHEPDNTKWYLDIENKEFYNQKTGELAPKKIQKPLKDKKFPENNR
ncbi:hypothetical protein [Bacillus changyiensis]|uniref:hypothetical protein n=1 Tax=Bacillus changyiensis TaxID=3004103 RepID=UPI0022E4A094|nr:hypothetical protein [Bacillus changyiensis]MDA1476424.1 hypothetical protein [Bacillus changyiensis]